MSTVSLEPVVPKDWTVEILTIIQLVYGIPSFVLLVYLYFYLWGKAVFSRSFYRFIQLDLLVNIFCYLNTWIGVRLYTFPFGFTILKAIGSVFPQLLTFSIFLAYWFQHMQFCCTIALSLNRLSSIIDNDGRYEKLWSTWYPLYAIASCVYSTLPEIPSGVFVTKVEVVDGVLRRTSSPPDIRLALNVVAVFSVLYLIVLLIVGPVTSYKASKHFKLVSSTSSGRSMTKEVGRRLTNISLTYCGVYTGNILWSVITTTDRQFPFLPNAIRELQQTSLTFASDSMVLSLPYILLIFDTNVRRQLVKCVKSSTTSVVHVTNNSRGVVN